MANLIRHFCKSNLANCIRQVTWSHFERLIRVEEEKVRNYYLIEAAIQNWAVRTLDRNISTLYYQRLISTQKSCILEQKTEKITSEFTQVPDDL